MKNNIHSCLFLYCLLTATFLNAWSPEDGLSGQKEGEHPFITACRTGHREAIQYYLEDSQFDPNQLLPSEKGKVSGLYMAVTKKKKEIITFLLSSDRINPECSGDESGTTPSSLAKRNGLTAITLLFPKKKKQSKPINNSSTGSKAETPVEDDSNTQEVTPHTESATRESTIQPKKEVSQPLISHEMVVPSITRTLSDPDGRVITPMQFVSLEFHKSKVTSQEYRLNAKEELEAAVTSIKALLEQAGSNVHSSNSLVTECASKAESMEDEMADLIEQLKEVTLQAERQKKSNKEKRERVKADNWRVSHDNNMSYSGNPPLQNPNEENSFVAACRTGNCGAIRHFVEQDSQFISSLFESKNPKSLGFSYTGLYLAAQKGHLEAVKTLVDLGADINQKLGNDETAFTTAAARGHWDIIEYLFPSISLCGSAQIYDLDGPERILVNIFKKASFSNESEIVENFLNESRRLVNPDIKIPIYYGNAVYYQTGLFIAASLGHVDTINVLIKAGCDINSGSITEEDYYKGNSSMRSPLYAAARHNRLEAARILLSTPGIQHEYSEVASPMHTALEHKHYEMAELLHSHGIPYLNPPEDPESLLRKTMLEAMNSISLLSHLWGCTPKGECKSLKAAIPEGLASPIEDETFTPAQIVTAIQRLRAPPKK